MRPAERILSAFAALAVTACAPAASRPRPAPSAQPPVRIVVLGDSLGLGTGASSPSGGFAFELYEALARTRPRSSIRDFAIGGARVADVARLQLPRLATSRYDVVLLVVGGNDVLGGTPAARFASRYETLVASIRTLQPHAALVLCGVPDVAISPLFTGSERATFATRSRNDDAAVRQIAAGRALGFIDLFAISRRAAHETAIFLGPDRFHPSDEGYRRIAARALPVVERALDAGAGDATSSRTRRTSRSD